MIQYTRTLVHYASPMTPVARAGACLYRKGLSVEKAVLDMAFAYSNGSSQYHGQGATRLQPNGRIGPLAELRKTLLSRYQIAVLRVLGLNRR